MELTLSTCFVQVQDPDEALAFYRDALGLELRNDVANDGCRWITVGAPSQPDVNIVLTDFVNGNDEDRAAVSRMLAKGSMSGVNFHVDDLEAALERARSAGAEVVSEIAEQPWGARDFALRAPSGTMVRVDQLRR